MPVVPRVVLLYVYRMKVKRKKYGPKTENSWVCREGEGVAFSTVIRGQIFSEGVRRFCFFSWASAPKGCPDP